MTNWKFERETPGDQSAYVLDEKIFLVSQSGAKLVGKVVEVENGKMTKIWIERTRQIITLREQRLEH